MAVIPQFDPAQSPSVGPQLQLEAENANSSWMTQAAQRQQIQATTAETQARTDQIQAMMPALVAKTQADTLAAQNEIASATLQQTLRGQWQSLKPQVIQDIGNITDPNNIPKESDGTPDWNAIYNKYETLQAKYGALDMLPEGKQYYQMIEDGKKNAFEMAARHAQAQLTLNNLKLASEYRLNNQEALVDKNATAKPAVAQAEAVNTQRNQAFSDIAAQRDALSQMGFSISNIGQDVAREQASPVAATAARFIGPELTGKVSSSVRQVGQDIGDFANRIMSTVKNIRNVNEFRAVTASIPRADDQPEVQNEKVAKLQTINQVLTQRNDEKERLLRADPNLTPDQADQVATAKYPFPASVMSGAAAVPTQKLTPEQAASLSPGTHFLGMDGIERVKN